MKPITIDDIMLRPCTKGEKKLEAPDLLGKSLGDIEFEELAVAMILAGGQLTPATATTLLEIDLPSDDEEE